MNISSAVFAHKGAIPARYTCDGENINPPLSFEGVPRSAKSLALIMHDPDVPTSLRRDGNFDHWVVWNLPPDTKELEAGGKTPGMSGLNTLGQSGYTGPCPPDREHRYFFTLYALDLLLNLPEPSTKQNVLAAMNHHILEQAILMGTYQRNLYKPLTH